MKQRKDNDCMPTCLSELLNIPYEEIPVFIDMDNIEDGDAFDKRVDTWLHSVGYFRITIPASYDKKDDSIKMPYVSLKKYRCIGILYQKPKKWSHAVILNVDINSDSISVDDPLGDDTDYSIEDIEEIELIIKKEPA